MITYQGCYCSKGSIVFSLIALLFLSACDANRSNRLSNASSPYLQQHADNPVHWYEWGSEALQKAKKENKPLLISIGYASCHWCHEMERESFMDTAVARLMNENFICIKVDREERPDIDNIYRNASQLISGNSGWPLNAFALPDGKPFFAGTYYSKKSWTSLLQQIVNAYATQNYKVVLQARALSQGIAKLEFSILNVSAASPVSKETYRHAFDNLYHRWDMPSGGLKGAPKFPTPSSIRFLLQYYFLTNEKRALEAATTTLTRMALGGIYDQVGGGFSRYSIDSLWRVPHFEKMLYDNAQLLSVYAHAYQLTGAEFFKNTVNETITFIRQELKHPDGGYYSSVNAVTSEGEGAFYTWSMPELKKALPRDHSLVADYYHVLEKGNWKEGRNILYADSTPIAFARSRQIDGKVFLQQLALAKTILVRERNKREKPSVDTKVLTSWNALLIKGLADAYAALGNESYLQDALSIGRFLEKNMVDRNGRVWRNYKDGIRSVPAFLDDYSLLAKAFIRLYHLTFDKHWLDLSERITGYAIRNFWDQRSGMFFYTAGNMDTSLIRRMEISDNEIPASNAVMAEVLYTLGVCLDKRDYEEKAKGMLSRMDKALRDEKINYYTSWCFLAGLLAYGTNEVVIVGPEAVVINRAIQKNYLPASIFIGSEGAEYLPLLKGKKNGAKTMIYVCTNRTCKRPVEDPASALHQLTQSQQPPRPDSLTR